MKTETIFWAVTFLVCVAIAMFIDNKTDSSSYRVWYFNSGMALAYLSSALNRGNQ